MDTIEHKGKTYHKAILLAKKYKYTSDYIGQLCRTGKVEAELVGRAWFVSEESLLNHRSDRYSNLRPSEIMIKESISDGSISTPVKIERVSVYPNLSKKTHKQIAQKSIQDKFNWQKNANLNYQPDNAELDPLLTRNKIITHDTINTTMISHNQSKKTEEESSVIKIKVSKGSVSDLNFSPLPEVYMEGVIPVSSLDDLDDYEEVTDSNFAHLLHTQHFDVENEAVSVVKRYQSNSVTNKNSISDRGCVHTKEFTAALRHVSVDDSNADQSDFVVVETSSKQTSVFYIIPSLVILSLFLIWFSFGLTRQIVIEGTKINQTIGFNVSSANSIFYSLSK